MGFSYGFRPKPLQRNPDAQGWAEAAPISPSRPVQACLRHRTRLLWRALLATLYSTAVRLREATNVTWADLDLKAGELHVTRKVAQKWVQPWTPKGHQRRTIPMPPQTVELLMALRATAPEGCPYVFMDERRWAYYSQQVEADEWAVGRDLMNNMLRKFKTLCRRAKVSGFPLHDLRRSCITNWAKTTLIHVFKISRPTVTSRRPSNFTFRFSPKILPRPRMLRRLCYQT
jgi:integrase